MRKSLWTILVVFVFTVLGSTSARADTIVASGGNVTAINGITVAGTTYNVTFGTTIDTTFAGNQSTAFFVNNAILTDLNTLCATCTTVGGAPRAGVDGGANTYTSESTMPRWAGGQYNTSGSLGYIYLVSNFPGSYLWDEFAVAPISTPEPGTLLLTLTGVVLLALLVVIRKCVALRHPQST